MKRPGDQHVRWGAQAVTFYNPGFWNRQSPADLLAYAQAHPHEFYTALLDYAEETEVDYFELCFEPGDWKTALRAFETAAGVVQALRARGLRLSGSYQGGHPLEEALMDTSVRQVQFEDLRQHAEFVSRCGADILLSGPPRRHQVAGAIDAEIAHDDVKRIAEIFEAMGRITAEAGVRLAIHTEAYSCVCRPRDIDRIMSLTDPNVVYLCPDAGHIALDGGSPVDVLRSHGSRVTSMHWKDCAGPRSSLPADGSVTHAMMMEQFRRAGTGVVDWGSVVEALRDEHFDGFAIAEIDLVPDPVGDTLAVLDFFDSSLAGIYR